MTNIDDLKVKQLEILHELDRVCNLIGINYYLAYGTCLGAVRHKGFIPWDDDIDVFITSKDMDVLLQKTDLFKSNYFLQSPETDPNYTNMKYSLRDSNTAYFSDEKDCDDINHGMFIDIYVLYPYPDNFIKAHKLILDSYILRFLYLKEKPRNHGRIAEVGFTFVNWLYPGSKANKKKNQIINNLKNNGGKHYYASFFGDDITPVSCFKFPMNSFRKPCYLKFEDYDAPCPDDPHSICELTYGKTYMEFPPEEKRASRHHVRFMSTEKTYVEYEGIYYYKDNKR